jgi:hypothetical protein
MNVDRIKFGKTPTTGSRYAGQDFPFKEEGFGGRFKFLSFEKQHFMV